MNKVFWFAALVLLIDIIDVAISELPPPETAVTRESKPLPHWSYTGKTGPEHWGKIAKTCQTGKQQSPIDIITGKASQLDAIDWDYQPKYQSIINNGHSIQVTLQPGSEIEINDIDYELQQFHFHSPSEHSVNGQPYPLETHFVHTDKKGNIAVVSVLFESGHANPALTALWQTVPKQTGTKASLRTTKFKLKDLLPERKAYYHFKGSLTTPPCTEGVQWYVLQQPISASPEQIAAFKALLPHQHNNRPHQALNQRIISTSQ